MLSPCDRSSVSTWSATDAVISADESTKCISYIPALFFLFFIISSISTIIIMVNKDDERETDGVAIL